MQYVILCVMKVCSVLQGPVLGRAVQCTDCILGTKYTSLTNICTIPQLGSTNPLNPPSRKELQTERGVGSIFMCS